MPPRDNMTHTTGIYSYNSHGVMWWFALCWFAFQCAVTVGATVLPPMRTIVNRLNRFGDFRFRIPDA